MNRSYDYLIIRFIKDTIHLDILNSNPVNYSITIMLNDGQQINIF